MNEEIQRLYISFPKRVVLLFGLTFVTGLSALAQTPQSTPPPQTPQQQQQRQEQPQPDRPQTTNPQTNPNTQPNTQPTNAQPTIPQTTSPTQTNPNVPIQTDRQQTVQPNQPAQPSQTVPNAPIQTPNQSIGTSGGIAPAVLPDDPPPIAPNFQAPPRPLPSADRVGVDIANQLPLSLQDVITMTLQNNNDIDASKNDVQIAEFNLRAARGVYDPLFVSENFYERRTTPTASTIGGAANGSVTQTSMVGGFGVSGFSPYKGGSYSLDFTSSRTNTTNQNATLNPQFPSSLTLTYTQPLFRGLRIDNNRRTIEIAKKNLSLTDAQFRQQTIEMIARVEQSYWDLAFALRNLQVQIDAVKQARVQLESNQRLVAKGALAPIEIIAANSQVTTFEQNVYTAQEAVTRAENNLKTMMLADRTSEIWKRPIVPITPVDLDIPKVPLEQAVDSALTNRQELAQLKTNTEINKINERFFRDQTKPQIDLFASYTGNGLAGSPTARATGTTGTGTTSALTTRVNELSALQGLAPLPPTTTNTIALPDNLIGGYFKSLSNLIGADYPTYQFGVRVSLPFGNRVAEANLGRTLVEGDRIKNQQEQAEQVIEADVRNTSQSLRSAEARLASAAASRASAEQLYDSEQRQFRAGTSTVFLVQQRQNELVAARGRELQAQTDLNKAISEFQRATGTTLTANNVQISGMETTIRNYIFRRPSEVGKNLFEGKK